MNSLSPHTLLSLVLQAMAHPVVFTAITANLGAALHGSIMSLTYDGAQRAYYTKVRGP